ncbi:hypothetical protein [Zhongshania marina]|uniref:Uncharacterized protein n=1 Tax=Zhongshania marina TaxID=2304603 RepID=A0A2S4HC01_9GAMM|nr:hypothetical protein [Marortus luteolus]POP51513.1 hypothetical protein C0068_16375 [Marortus luteolus]
MNDEEESLALPELVAVGQYEPSYPLKDLSRSQKKQLWAHLKRYHCNIAASLTVDSGDQGFCKLMSEFDGNLVLHLKYFPADIRSSIESEINFTHCEIVGC